MVRGQDYPIVETAEESGISRFIMPSANDLTPIPTERNTKRALLFDTAGLALFNKESRQMQTAESKQFDLLDTASTLKNRALILQEAEVKLVALSKELEGEFDEYEPQWPVDFEVPDVPALMSLVSILGNHPDITPTMRKMLNVVLISIMSEYHRFDQELITKAKDEIEKQPGFEKPNDGDEDDEP